MKAIVIGAGLSGLVTAYRLRQAGWSVTVLESSAEVGGRAVSVRKGGYLFDAGAVGLGTVYKDYMDLVDELGLSSEVVKSSTIASTVRNGRLYEIDSARPITGLTTGLLSFRSKLKLVRLLSDVAKAKPHLDIRDVAAAAGQLDDESAASYAKRRLNDELLEYFIEPMIRTVNLSRAADVSKLELMNSLAGLFDTTLVTLRGGVGVFAAALAKGMDVRLQCTARTTRLVPGGVEVTYSNEQGVAAQETADVCVITAPLPQALELYPAARDKLGELATMIRYNRGLCVHLGYKRRTRTPALMAMFPPTEDPHIALFFFEHNKAPDRAPDGHSMITVFFDETTIDKPWQSGDQELVRTTSSRVERIIPELAGKLEMSHVSRWHFGLTHPAPGVYRAMRAANEAVSAADRVQLTGDYRSTAGQNSAVAWANNTASMLIKHYPG